MAQIPRKGAQTVSKSSSDMKLLDHLGELRRRLAVAIGVNLVAAVILFQYAAVIMEYLFAINPGMELVYISPQELLLVYIQLAFLAALVLCSPVTIYEIWAFVSKGLYKHERGAVILSLVSGLACFVAGAVFCYLVVLPITLQFFVRISTEEVTAMISVQNYANFINKMLLAFGVVFEMPVLVFLFSKLGYLHPESIRDKRGEQAKQGPDRRGPGRAGLRLRGHHHPPGRGLPADAGRAHAPAHAAELLDLLRGGKGPQAEGSQGGPKGGSLTTKLNTHSDSRSA